MPDFRIVDRKESVSPNGRLQLIIEPDGDVIVSVYPDPDEQGLGEESIPGTVQICTPFSGGGGSPRTHRALLALFRAMSEDNADEMYGNRRGDHPGLIDDHRDHSMAAAEEILLRSGLPLFGVKEAAEIIRSHFGG